MADTCTVLKLETARRVKNKIENFSLLGDLINPLMQRIMNAAIDEVQALIAEAMGKYINNPYEMLSSILNSAYEMCGAFADGEWIQFYLNKFIDEYKAEIAKELAMWQSIRGICNEMYRDKSSGSKSSGNKIAVLYEILEKARKIGDEINSENDPDKKVQKVSEIKSLINKALILSGGKGREVSDASWTTCLEDAFNEINVKKAMNKSEVNYNNTGIRALGRSIQPRCEEMMRNDIRPKKAQGTLEVMYNNLARLSTIMTYLTGYTLKPALDQLAIIKDSDPFDVNVSTNIKIKASGQMVSGTLFKKQHSPAIVYNGKEITDKINAYKEAQGITRKGDDKIDISYIKKLVSSAAFAPKDNYSPADKVWPLNEDNQYNNYANGFLNISTDTTPFPTTVKKNRLAQEVLFEMNCVLAKVMDGLMNGGNAFGISLLENKRGKDALTFPKINGIVTHEDGKEVFGFSVYSNREKFYSTDKTEDVQISIINFCQMYIQDILAYERELKSSNSSKDAKEVAAADSAMMDELISYKKNVGKIGLEFVKTYSMNKDMIFLALNIVTCRAKPVTKNMMDNISLRIAYLQDLLAISSKHKPLRNVRLESLYEKLYANGMGGLPVSGLMGKYPALQSVMQAQQTMDAAIGCLNSINGIMAGMGFCQDWMNKIAYEKGDITNDIIGDFSAIIGNITGYTFRVIFETLETICDLLLRAVGWSFGKIMYCIAWLESQKADEDKFTKLIDLLSASVDDLQNAITNVALAMNGSVKSSDWASVLEYMQKKNYAIATTYKDSDYYTGGGNK